MSARYMVVAAVLGLCAPIAGAQTPSGCTRSQTANECIGTLLRELDAAEVREDLTKATTGVQSALDLSSAVRDFVPQVAAALVTPGLSADREALALRANHPTALGAIQVAVELPEPEPFGPLLQAVAEDRRDAVRERLEASLEDADDVIASVALNVETERWGRRFAPHAVVLDSVLQAIFPSQTGDDTNVTNALISAVRLITRARTAGAAVAEGCDANLPESDLPLRCIRASAADSVIAILTDAVRSIQGRRASRAATLDRARFSALPMLLNNQPQLNVSFSYRYRSDLVGPDEMTGSLRFEVGTVNLNTLRGRCRTSAIGPCMAAMLRDPATTAGLARGRRFAVQLDVSYRAEYDAMVPGETEAIAVAEERSMGLKGSAAYGQYFGRLATGTRRPRIDLQLDVERQLEGALRNDRVVGRVAYTHPVSDQLAGVLGMVWANKPEYLGDEIRTVSARLGLTYKLVQPE